MKCTHNRIVVAILVLLSYSACNNVGSVPASKNSTIDTLDWLIGSWQNISEEMQSYESWTKKNDSVYSGISFALKKGDTVFMEHLSLEAQGADLFYIPSVSNQNEGKPVTFRLVSSAGGLFVFENKEHDFPQRIGYTHPAPDSIYAYIEGNEKGQFHRIEFPMKRVGK